MGKVRSGGIIPRGRERDAQREESKRGGQLGQHPDAARHHQAETAHPEDHQGHRGAGGTPPHDPIVHARRVAEKRIPRWVAGARSSEDGGNGDGADDRQDEA